MVTQLGSNIVYFVLIFFNFKVPLSMRAIIKLGCVCKVNKIFAKLFNGKVSTDIFNFLILIVFTRKALFLLNIVLVKALNYATFRIWILLIWTSWTSRLLQSVLTWRMRM